MIIKTLLGMLGVMTTGLITGCSSSPKISGESEREPAHMAVTGGLTDPEATLCLDLECKHLIAPCNLRERNHASVVSAMDEAYLIQFEKLAQHGFCLGPPRELEPDQYATGTCLFLFVKKDRCD